MNQNVSVNVRVTEKVKTDAESVLKELGLTMSDAVNIYLRQIALKRGIPFGIRIPNRKTVRAMEDVEKKRNLKSFDNVNSLMEDLKS
ncbi:MAG: type II toxin-antitoxin system antitoxin, RelB/DinJ family [Candidatus Marinimicrobia bacterium CG08_land_8_20_14_0_20_45_22]|nr:MAG: type II toxin-antitoxin system antitoxin, RelB/DinJ family [Candidatus Marinimicrobia bacterium CG08_land_8_20_14_0_20_45_22]